MILTLAKKSKSSTCIEFITKDSINPIQDFDGEAGQIAVRYLEAQTLIYCGLGDVAKYTTATLRRASAVGLQRAKSLKRTSISVIPPVCAAQQESVDAIIEGLMLGDYSFSTYKPIKPQSALSVELISKSYTQKRLDRIMSICYGTNYARALVNENAHIVTPEYLAHHARAISQSQKCSVTILDETQLQAQGLNLICAVGSGSATPPRLIILKYTSPKPNAPTVAIIGKGITFDSGGQNLKPTGSIETMRCDMAGAAAVLGFFSSINEINPSVNIIGVIPSAHNAIDSLSYFPGDIYTAYNKKTVEINNTDAEGRLVLADAISYTIDKHKPDAIIDLATLTGGILVALGDTIAGLFCNNDALANKLFTAGETSGERLWRFPLYPEYTEAMKSDCADLRNSSKLKKGWASSITGAAFIQEFVAGTPWAHLDIAGTAFNEGEAKGEIPKYGTGFGVRLLAQHLGNYLSE